MPQALLAAFPDPATARGIDAAIERGLAQGGAEDVSARFRGPQRLVEFEGGTYLLPTVIYCDDLEHPLANQEYLFPFVSVLDVPAAELIDTLGPSLVVTALTDDPRLERDLLGRHEIGRLNLGPVPTSVIAVGPAARRKHFYALVPAAGVPAEKFADAVSAASIG